MTFNDTYSTGHDISEELSKQFLVLRVVEPFRSSEETLIFMNWEMKQEAIKELQTFEEQLRFEKLLKHSPQISPEAIEEKVA